MTSRERLLCVLQGEIPDQVPVSPFVQEEYLSWYFDKKDTSRLYDAVQLAKELDFDLITRQYINPIPYFLKNSTENWKVHISEGKEGNNYVRRTKVETPKRTMEQVAAASYNEKILSGIHFSTVEYLIKDEDDFYAFKEYCPRHSAAEEDFILKQGKISRAEVGDLGITCPWSIGGVYNLVSTYMDVQDMLCDALGEEEYYEEYMNFFTDLVEEENKIYARSDFDAVGVQGNIANGAIMNDEYFDEFVLPYERRALEPLIRCGKPTIYHNCGNAKVLYPEYKKLGITVWETVSANPQGDNVLSEAKEYFQDSLILSGNFDQIHFLKEASPEEIEKEAYAQMMIGKQNGHYIFACSDYLEIGTPLENVKAMLRGARKAAKYE
ncbi:hypothetical protein DWX43_05220 [Clostridium sp. AF19-22AC]|uniref:uroporphyrinogen decarboxylase family protein n=1 Tax=Clostridia TaxID=186801 RepID=UPI000E4915D7|nr:MULTISPECIES: uroporphyrinogen decarboxylase family protein [Clostridia]RHR32049.1 hypothetical protein DWX43_05220 [Clostridium sp. AF19-22AC]